MIKRILCVFPAVMCFVLLTALHGMSATPLLVGNAIEHLDKAVEDSVDALKATDSAVQIAEEALSNAESMRNSRAASEVERTKRKINRIFSGQQENFRRVQKSAGQLRSAVSGGSVDQASATFLTALIEVNKNVLRSEARRAEVQAHFATLVVSDRQRHKDAVRRQVMATEQSAYQVRQQALRVEKLLGLNMSMVSDDPVGAANRLKSVAASRKLDVAVLGDVLGVMRNASNVMTGKMDAHERLVNALVSMDDNSISEAEDALAVVSQVAETMMIMTQQVVMAFDRGDLAAIEEASALAVEADTYVELALGVATDGDFYGMDGDAHGGDGSRGGGADIIDDIDEGVVSPSQ